MSTPDGTSAGFGKGGQGDSATRAAISGIAGDKSACTGDPQCGSEPIFDTDKLLKEVQAQVAIPQAFGHEGSKTVADYAARKLAELKAREQADSDYRIGRVICGEEGQ